MKKPLRRRRTAGFFAAVALGAPTRTRGFGVTTRMSRGKLRVFPIPFRPMLSRLRQSMAERRGEA